MQGNEKNSFDSNMDICLVNQKIWFNLGNQSNQMYKSRNISLTYGRHCINTADIISIQNVQNDHIIKFQEIKDSNSGLKSAQNRNQNSNILYQDKSFTLVISKNTIEGEIMTILEIPQAFRKVVKLFGNTTVLPCVFESTF